MIDDPFTMEVSLCGDDGIVRGGAMHHGVDYPCTGHAHFAGEHIRCTSPAHSDVPALPGDLLAALQDPNVVLPGEMEVMEKVVDWTLSDVVATRRTRTDAAAKAEKDGEC